MQKQHPNKNEGDLKTLSSNNSRSWFMIKYLIKKTKNKDFKEYFTK